MPLSNTYDTTNPGSAVSNREDLTDSETILAPEETPVYASATKFKAKATFTEWTVDTLDAVSTAGIAEGDDVDAFTDKFSGRARLGNYVQKFRKDFMVSDLQQAVESVGPAKIALAESKAIREIKRNIEATLNSGNDRAVEDGAGTVYKLRGLDDWIDSAGPSDVPAAFRTPSGSIHSSGAFTETIFNNLITSIYRVTGTSNSLTLFTDTALRRVITDFTRLSGSTDGAIRSVNYDGNKAQIKLSVQMYLSDHGMVSIVNGNPDCQVDTTNKDYGYLMNLQYYSIARLIPLGSTMLPNFGGGERGYVDTTLTLCVKHPGAHGKITVISA